MLEKEIYIPEADTTMQTVTEYFYTNGKLSSDKRSSLNKANPASPVSTVLLTHTYSFIGNQLLKTITQNGVGAQTSIENYTYSNENNVPTVVRQINSVADGLSTETYFQKPGAVNPYAYLIPGSPMPTLFLSDSAKFSNPALINYKTFSTPGMTVVLRYEYANKGAANAYYYLEEKM